MQLKRDELISHFSAFGDIENVRICNKAKRPFAYVKFTLAESASKALGIDSHIIAGRRVNVAASCKHQDNTSLLDLNDDCLLEILSMNCLDLSDLLLVAHTCRRLKEIAGRVFRREHKTCDISSLCEGDVESAQLIMKMFGSEITDLEIGGCLEILLPSVAEYCSTLKSLYLYNLVILENCWAAEFRFKNLQKLRIKCCSFEGASKQIFADCGSLVELEITGRCSEFILGYAFPKLQRFERRHDFDGDLIESFISRHRNLKSLKIDAYVSPYELQLIAKGLETLACWIPIGATLDLSNISHLRELHIHCGGQNVTQTALELDKLKLLESLTLQTAGIDQELIRTLSQLKKLQVMELLWCTELDNLNRIDDLDQLTTLKIVSWQEHVDSDIVLLVQRMSKLNYLRIQVPQFEMNMEKYLKIVDVVRRRPNRSKLTFELRSSYYEDFNCDMLRQCFTRNAHLVEIKFENDRL